MACPRAPGLSRRPRRTRRSAAAPVADGRSGACCGVPMIALVGARNASSLGTRMARASGARTWARRGTSSSRALRAGIDTAAHRGDALPPARSPSWRAASTWSIRSRMPCSRRKSRSGAPAVRTAHAPRAAGAPLPAPQPHHLGPVAGGRRGRGRGEVRQPDHRARRRSTRGARCWRCPATRSTRARRAATC